MIGAWPQPARRALAIGILLLLLFGLVFEIVLPLIGAFQGDEDQEASLRLLAGYQRVAALRPQIEQRLAARAGEEAALPGLWPGATPTLASNALQGEARRLVEAAGGRITTMQPLPASREAGFDKIGFRIDLTLPMPGLPGLLQSFDAHTPFLFLDKVDLHAPEAPGKTTPLLTIHWEVFGYRAEKPV